MINQNQISCASLKLAVHVIQAVSSPDISEVQQLPSISPCSHLPPATRHPGPAAHVRITGIDRCYLAFVLYLVGLQFLCIVGEPLDQVTRDHVAGAAGKRRVGWTRVLQLLPLPDAIHCPALPETGSEWQIHHHPNTVSLSGDLLSF